MIVDHIRNAETYSALPASLQRALRYLSSTDFTTVENGRYELEGTDLISIVNRGQTKLPENAVWESHRKYIDVQFIAAGVERFGYSPLSAAPPVKMPYSAEKDVIFYEPGTQIFDAPTGTFMIFYPDDIHAPGLAVGSPPVAGDVLKVVVKVAVTTT